jgi:glutaminase
MGATLANGGVDPKTNERVVIAEVAWYLLSQLRQTGRQGSRQQGQA